MLHSIRWKIASTRNKSHWTALICPSLEHSSMRNCHTYTHTELNKVHNVQCFDELLYQECNVSITPFPGAVTMSPKNAGNTVSVQVSFFQHLTRSRGSPIISLICLAPSVTLSVTIEWKNRPEKTRSKYYRMQKILNILEHAVSVWEPYSRIWHTVTLVFDTKYNSHSSTTCTLSITLCDELPLDLSFPCFTSLLHYRGSCISPGTRHVSVSRSPAAS